MPMPTMAPTATAWPITAMAMVLPTMDMAMATMDTTARGLLMLRPPPPLMLMLTMPPIPMLTMDTMARGLLMLPPLLMLTMALMAMVWLTTDTAMDMPITDTTDIPMPTTATPMDSTDIINLLIFVKN